MVKRGLRLLRLACGSRVTIAETPLSVETRAAMCSHRFTQDAHSAAWSRRTHDSTAASMPIISSRPTFIARA
jgi:hypothetical protein